MLALRPYQVNTVDGIRAEVAAGARSVCVVMPTGAGKTRTLGEIVRRTVAKGNRALWLAHRGELVDQAVCALRDIGIRAGAISASAASTPQPYAPVQVATIQTLLARNLRPEAAVIVADEAHHYVAETWHPLLKDYPKAIILGPTATPERGDGRGLGDLFTGLVVGARVKELVDGGFLVPASLIRPERKLQPSQIAQRPVDAYLQHARGRRAIVFAPRVPLAKEHARQFEEAGFKAAVVTGNTPWLERRKAFDDLRAGKIHALCNVYVATEGFDVVELDCVILARTFGTAGQYLQCVGRALRPAPGKKDALIIDLTGTSFDHGHPCDDRVYSLEGKGISEPSEEIPTESYCRVCNAVLPDPSEPCPECGTPPREVVQVVVGERLVPYAWMRSLPQEKKNQILQKWIEIGRAKGYKPGWAYHRARAVFG